MTGQFGLCGFFKEYDRELSPEERLQFKPDEIALFTSVLSISVLNLIIHTPQHAFSNVYFIWEYIPDYVKNNLITNTKHFHHHEVNPKSHYSAPLLDLDEILMLNN